MTCDNVNARSPIQQRIRTSHFPGDIKTLEQRLVLQPVEGTAEAHSVPHNYVATD